MRRVPFPDVGKPFEVGAINFSHLHYGENFSYWRETHWLCSTFVL